MQRHPHGELARGVGETQLEEVGGVVAVHLGVGRVGDLAGGCRAEAAARAVRIAARVVPQVVGVEVLAVDVALAARDERERSAKRGSWFDSSGTLGTGL